MKRVPRPLHRVITDDAVLGAWQARRAREEALLAAVRRELPRQLGERLRAGALENGDIELIAPTGAVATAVRQRSPDIARRLREQGWPCGALRVRVQVAVTAPAPARAQVPSVDRNALAPLVQLGADLPNGPLKTALARLLRRTRG